MKLTKSTSRSINWERIEDSTAGLRSKKTEDVAVDDERPIDAAKVKEFKKVFDTAKEEFENALKTLKKSTNGMVFIVFAGVTVAILGGLWAIKGGQQLAGGLMSAAGIASITTLTHKFWGLGRDQAMLSLIPARYELAFRLARTQKQYDDLLDQFMEETSSLRG